jgi:hypothetical protein
MVPGAAGLWALPNERNRFVQMGKQSRDFMSFLGRTSLIRLIDTDFEQTFSRFPVHYSPVSAAYKISININPF